MEKIGEGAYGIVYRGIFGTNKKVQVIKRNIVDQTSCFLGCVRELDILMIIKEHPNMVKLNSILFGLPENGILSPLKRELYKDDTIHFIFENESCNLVDLMKV